MQVRLSIYLEILLHLKLATCFAGTHLGPPSIFTGCDVGMLSVPGSDKSALFCALHKYVYVVLASRGCGDVAWYRCIWVICKHAQLATLSGLDCSDRPNSRMLILLIDRDAISGSL